MIHVISAANRHLYEGIIEQHFRLRHDIFVGERKWITLARPDGREVDAYDDDDTVYLLAIEGERVVGGHRLYPTVRTSMIAEIFPHLASIRGAPSDPAIWEWSRFFIVKERRDGRLNIELMAAVQELCLEEGITQVSAVIELWWLPRFQEAGFVVRPLGLPDLVENAWTMAAVIEVSEATLKHVKAVGGFDAPVLTRRGRQEPIVDRALRLRRAAKVAGAL